MWVLVETGNNLQTTALNHKLIRKIKDDLFDEENIDQYHLLINIGTRDFQLLVIEPTRKQSPPDGGFCFTGYHFK